MSVSLDDLQNEGRRLDRWEDVLRALERVAFRDHATALFHVGIYSDAVSLPIPGTSRAEIREVKQQLSHWSGRLEKSEQALKDVAAQRAQYEIERARHQSAIAMFWKDSVFYR